MTQAPQHKAKSASKPVSKDVADLYVRLDAQDCTPNDMRQLMDWAVDHPEKLDEMEDLSKLYELVGRVRPDEAVIHAPSKPASFWAQVRDWGWGYRSLGTAGGLMAAAFMVFFLSYTALVPDNALQYHTNIGELRNVALNDGSRVHLNGDSQLTVRYQEHQRYLTLSEGEAFFEVAKDHEREFVVEVGGVLVKAVGTAFNIDYTGDNITVSVTEGTVKIDLAEHAREASQQDSAELYASVGEQVAISKVTPGKIQKSRKEAGPSAAYRAGSYLLTKATVPLDHSSSWREGVLHLDGEGLGKTVNRINRQSLKQIAISDVRLTNLPIYGSFHLDDPDSFIKAVEVLYPIEHIRTEQGYLLVYSGDK